MSGISGLAGFHPGQHCPQQCPPHCPYPGGDQNVKQPAPADRLGPPLDIHQVAKLIGCSVWSVRQRHIRAGLPYFRSSPNGKLIFYKAQVVRWILRQQKGGIPK